MGNPVENRITPEQWAARLAGLGLVVVSLLLWAAVALLREWTREVLLAPLVDRYEAEFARALVVDALAMSLVAGLLLLGRRVGTTVAVAAVVLAARAADHVAVAQQSAFTLGVDVERWRVVGVDAPHLAVAVAITAALLFVRAIVRDGAPTLARHAFVNAIAWPIVALAVIAAKGYVGGFAYWIVILAQPPLLVAVIAEAVLVAATLSVAARAAAFMLRARREALRRREAGLDPVDVAEARDDCARCGYDLTGLDDAAACPECGLGVERSRTMSTQLRDAPPEWLRDVARGAAVLAGSMALVVAWPYVFDEWLLAPFTPARFLGIRGGRNAIARALSGGPTLFGVSIDLHLLRFAPWFAACVALALGLWMITRLPRREPTDVALRTGLRVAAFAPALAVLVLFLNERMNGNSRAYALAATALLTIGCAPIPGLAFALFRRLAQRALDARLAEHATIVGVGFAVTLIATPVTFALADIVDGGDWARRSPATLAMLSAATVAFVLFSGWAAVTCGRCAVAFGRAARAARLRWEEADRGTNDGDGGAGAERGRVARAD